MRVRARADQEQDDEQERLEVEEGGLVDFTFSVCYRSVGNTWFG